MLFTGRLTDVATASKLVRADVVELLQLEGNHFDLDFELPAKILMAGYRIEEIPITYRPRTYEEGKKIGARDFVEAVWTMLRARLGLSPVFRQAASAAELRNP
jgi:hypothetical protein